MTKEVTSPAAPAPRGRYSQAIRAGDLVFISGQVPRDRDGRYTPASIGDETRRTLENLELIVDAAGGTLADVVKVTAYLSDADDFSEFDEAYAPFFPDAAPARTTITAGLREVKVEIDAILFLQT